MFGLRVTPTLFLSTPSARRATSCANRKRPTSADFYPRPPRGGRLLARTTNDQRVPISIHALREEGDLNFCPECGRQLKFLSTPSARRATNGDVTIKIAGGDFYPRPPRGGRRTMFLPVSTPSVFLSTPSARRATCAALRYFTKPTLFLSTPSARRATAACGDHAVGLNISIHALREEGDDRADNDAAVFRQFLSTPSARRATGAARAAERSRQYFYPRPPRGGRHAGPDALLNLGEFLSTPSARRATLLQGFQHPHIPISIHALREEGDSKNRDKISIFKQIIQHSARI